MFLLILKEQSVTKKSGFALLEVILSAALFLIITSFAVQAFLYGEEATTLSEKRQRASLYAEEGLEAVRNIRDLNFSNLVVGGPYGISTSTGNWTISGTSNTDGEFTRRIFIGSNGINRLVATSTVDWNQNAQRDGSLSLVTYITNWAKSGIGNWSLPEVETGYAGVSTSAGVDVAISGDYAYVIMASSTPNFLVINISSTTNPVLVCSTNLVSNLSSLIVSDNYAYVTGTGNNNELQIINITDKSAPSLISTFNAVGNNDAYDLVKSGNYIYFVRALSVITGQNEFEVVNVSNPALPTSISGLDLEATAQDISIFENYAFVASQDDIREFQVIDVSNPALPARVAAIDIIGTATASNGRAITINGAGTIAFISRVDGTVYPIDITNKTNPVLLMANGWSTVGSASDMVLFNNDTYLALANTHVGSEQRIVDVTNPIVPKQLSILDISGTTTNFLPTGIDYSPIYDRLYLAGQRLASSSNRQLIITKPQ